MSDAVIIALAAAVPPTVAVILAAKHANRKLDHIHVLVNSRLATALEEIAVLKQSIQDDKQ